MCIFSLLHWHCIGSFGIEQNLEEDWAQRGQSLKDVRKISCRQLGIEECSRSKFANKRPKGLQLRTVFKQVYLELFLETDNCLPLDSTSPSHIVIQ